jgi:hypothetical protein
MKRLVGLGAMAIAVAALLCTPAMAGGRHHRHGKGRHHKEHRVRVQHHRPHRAHPGRVRAQHGRHGAYYGRARVRGAFVIPGHIGHGHAHVYRPYYHGRTFFAPHRHYHAVYYFPVYTPSGYVLRPHSYCGGSLHRTHVAYRGPRISIGVSF